ncbi:MAG: MBL fold metallo-hydrolase, partial [Gammaproteobacteria bacterium]
DITLDIHHTGPAHTDHDVMVELTNARVLFAGDVIEHGRLVSSDVPRDFNVKGQIEAIKYLLKLPVETFVPGHGVTGNRQIALDALRFLQILYNSVNKHYHRGMLDYEMRDLVATDLYDFREWFNFNELGRIISFVYQQVEADAFN